MIKHTPGPWVLRTTESHVHNEPGRLRYIGKAEIWTSGPKGEFQDQIDEADGRLIAAAPDLLDACEDVASDGDRVFDDRNILVQRIHFDRLLAAVARATGGKP